MSDASPRSSWWWDWMKRIRWSENVTESYAKQSFVRVLDINVPPTCKCGTTMQAMAGYLMGGPGDWVAFSCPKDRPWHYRAHSPWTTQLMEKRRPSTEGG